ncbi:predicted protein [Phaeodactylum tricornutum CCAP 1055/1]|uniref:RCK C-terminal domain-containing protein n=2 Tax=Phaeodactylum tricornutum TaxID=2850 RepID=B7G767_PHATC|nr:predicted protein [Phaeodactylum tricornutum CCAP 1055/1]EEC45713.1 predicted protein [Phaeodactylum tricornutum CCAP 1055/1]|eukprot:XP_002182977.1 predicted protein [Phaeodactylum tricornutum CCAP 1055/1]
MFAALASDRLGADSIILAALTALMAAQVITVKEGFQGFANEGVLTVLALFVVAEGITKTGALDWYIGKVLGSPTNASSAQLRILAPVTFASAFLNNTPIVVVMIPIIQKWARNIHIPVQQLMIPLSFASILGGTCTLIGTSTNLVVVGLLEERYPNDPDVSIGLFDIGLYGVPVALVGMAYILFASPYLLPGGGGQSQDALNSLEKNEEILLGARLTSWSPAVSRTVKRSGLRDTGGIYLVSVVRAATGHAYQSIAPEEPLQHGDVLWFSGSASSVGDLRKIPGLISYQNDEVEKINEKVHDRRLVQAVIARKGPLVGKTVKEVQFRKRYGAAVIAVHREGKRVHEHPGNVKLQAGDVLLLEAGPSFIAKSGENDRSFALLAEVEDSAPPRLSLLIPALLITAGMLVVFMADWTSLLVSALVASMLMVALGILSEQEARDAVNWEVFITVAAAFGIGTALVNSGVAGGIANFLVDVGTALGIGEAGLLGAVYFATFLISNVVTNNAAAALLFPVALNAAEQTGTDRVLMSYALMLGASASFMSPFGYTTNLLIYGPGGYKYKDFLLFGTPMQIVLWVASIAFLAIIEPWYISWIAAAAILGIIIALRLFCLSRTALRAGEEK